MLTVDSGLKLGKIVQDFSHLVTTLSASDVNDTVGVRVLGEGLGNTGLTASEGSGNSASTTLNSREEGIEHTLSSEERVVTGELFSNRSGVTDRPEVRHVNFDLALVGVEDSNGLADVVHTCRHDFDDATSNFGGDHDTVLVEQIVLEDSTKDITTNDELTNLEVLGSEFPQLVLVEGGNIDTTGNENGFRKGGDSLEGSLDTVENSLQDT